MPRYTVDAMPDAVDPTLSHLTMVVRLDDDNNDGDASQRFSERERNFFRNNIVDAGATEEERRAQEGEGSAEDHSLARLLRAIGQLPQVVEVVPVGKTPAEAAAAEYFAAQSSKSAAGPTDVEEEEDAEEDAGPGTGLLYLVHDFASAPSWSIAAHYAALPRDPYVRDIGVVGSLYKLGIPTVDP